MSDSLLNIGAVATKTGVSYGTAAKLVRTGLVPAMRVGNRWRVRPEELESYISRSVKVATKARSA